MSLYNTVVWRQNGRHCADDFFLDWNLHEISLRHMFWSSVSRTLLLLSFYSNMLVLELKSYWHWHCLSHIMLHASSVSGYKTPIRARRVSPFSLPMDNNMLCYLSVSCLGTKKTRVGNTNVYLSPACPLPSTGISVGTRQHICCRLAARHQNHASLTRWSGDKIVDILQTAFSNFQIFFFVCENYWFFLVPWILLTCYVPLYKMWSSEIWTLGGCKGKLFKTESYYSMSVANISLFYHVCACLWRIIIAGYATMILRTNLQRNGKELRSGNQLTSSYRIMPTDVAVWISSIFRDRAVTEGI